MSDRERAQSELTTPIDKSALRIKITAKVPINQQPQQRIIQNTQKLADELQQSKKETPKTYVCDSCKICDEFERLERSSECKNCGCDLIHHVRDGDESQGKTTTSF